MKVFRKEHFGGVLFDTNTLRYELTDTDVDVVSDRLLPSRQLPERRDILSAPIRVYFEITRRCNLTCRHCFVSSSPLSYLGMPTHLMLSLLDELELMNVFDLRITGGEPTVRPDWFELLRHAKDLGFSLSLNTNGVYESAETIDQLLSLELEQITVSIDGIGETHNSIRGAGAFDASFDAIRNLRAGGASTRVNTVLTRANVTEVPGIIETFAPFVDEINFFYMRPVGRAVLLGDQHLDFETHYRSATETLALRSSYPSVRIMHFEQSFIERSILPEESSPKSLAMALPYGSTTLSLHADGSIWPHGYTPYQAAPRFKIGEYPQVNIPWAWHESPVLDGVRAWLRALLGRCSSCVEYKTRCAGLNFEMEVARQAGHISENPYCISDLPLPELTPYIAAALSSKTAS